MQFYCNRMNHEKIEIKKTNRKNKENKQKKGKKKQLKSKRQTRQENHLYILWNSIYKNYLFFIVLFYCFYLLKNNKKYNSSYFILLTTFILSSISGYFVHYISHHINFTEFYENCDNMFTRNKYTNYVLSSFVSFIDFHDKTHHDNYNNKEIKNIIYEFINNVFMQGIGMVIVIHLLKLLDTRIIILWAFMYATIHNINYLYLNPTTHKCHHLNYHTNYGIDYVDIVFNTKYDINDVEIYNHAVINLLIITYILMYFT